MSRVDPRCALAVLVVAGRGRAGRRRCLAAAILLALGAASPAWSERLPFRLFSMADGLAQNRVKCIVSDSRGFVWLCTPNGLSRFDGQRFVSYRTADGLPHNSVNAIVEAPDGTYWIATNGGGVARFDPAGRHVRRWPPPPEAQSLASRFTVLLASEGAAAKRVNALHVDRDGRLWAGTDAGLFRHVPPASFERVDLSALGLATFLSVWNIVEEDDGTLWVGTTHGLVRRRPTGEWSQHPVKPGATDRISALASTGDGQIWVGHETGLYRLTRAAATANGDAAGPAIERPSLPALRALRGVRALFAEPGASLWIGCADGTVVAYDDRGVQRYGAAHGLPPTPIRAIGGDAQGNVWVGYTAGGAARIARHGFRTYGENDGLESEIGYGLLETLAGEVCVMSGVVEGLLQCFDGEAFVSVRPNLPAPAQGWQFGRRTLQDREGDWWFGTEQGVIRLPKVSKPQDLARVAPTAAYTTREGLPADRVQGLFEDSRANIWIWAAGQRGFALSRWDRTLDRLVRIDEVPAAMEVYDLAEDAANQIWMAFRSGGVARLRGGRLELFGPEVGLPDQWTGPLHADRQGRLWIGTGSSGVVRVDAPGDERPRFTTYSAVQGLTAGRSGCFTEDRWGRIYLCVADGVDRLDAERRWVRHYGVDDGLAGPEVTGALADRAGALWFATQTGISRIVPERDDPRPTPDALVSAFRISGVPYPLSALGQTEVPEVILPSSFAPIEIEYFSTQDSVRYEYRLEGAGGDWQSPTRQTVVTFANLAPGRYRFGVRALGPAGDPSSRPAVVSFTVMPPVWRRSWFLALVAGGVAGIGYGIHRLRVARLLALERMRTRIATDLHDDIGASLSQISILSEVISRDLAHAHPSTRARLASIAHTARELVDAMSDIVWAINPSHDHLDDLVGRMRRFASDVLTSRGIDLRFDASSEQPNVHLPPELRREVFLILKEAVNNVARHAGCARADVHLRVEKGALELTVADDGQGLLEGGEPAGHGLTSLRARAARLGGTLDVASQPGRGTTLRLSLPLRDAQRPVGRRARPNGRTARGRHRPTTTA